MAPEADRASEDRGTTDVLLEEYGEPFRLWLELLSTCCAQRLLDLGSLDLEHAFLVSYLGSWDDLGEWAAQTLDELDGGRHPS